MNFLSCSTNEDILTAVETSCMEDYNDEFDVDDDLPGELVDTPEYVAICFLNIHFVLFFY